MADAAGDKRDYLRRGAPRRCNRKRPTWAPPRQTVQDNRKGAWPARARCDVFQTTLVGHQRPPRQKCNKRGLAKRPAQRSRKYARRARSQNQTRPPRKAKTGHT
eukprot:10035051-Lingulodinium_polyedra.AAC.1